MAVVRLRDGVALAYAAQGPAAGGAVVLLAGPTGSWRSYAPALDALPGDVPAVAASLRGHGDSSKPATGYGVDLASDVVPMFDALDIGRAVVVGHSGSCLVARRVALDAPDRVAGLVLEASATLRDDPGLRGFVDSFVAELTEPIDVARLRRFVTDTSAEGLAPGLVDMIVAEERKLPIVAWRELFASLLVYDAALLERLSAPVLLVWGDDDPLVSRAVQDELLARRPHAELTVYEGAGRTPRWEQPERFARDVATFSSVRSEVARACADGPTPIWRGDVRLRCRTSPLRAVPRLCRRTARGR